MDDDISRRTNQPDDAFDDALDDLFGPPQSGAEPTANERAPQKPLAKPPASYPRHDEYVYHQQRIAPQTTSKQGTSVVRILGIGCVGLVVLLVGCVVILAIIGALFGDTTTASALMHTA